MEYFCSDLHGEYDLFRRLLDACRIDDSDVVYILGDVIDKGQDSFRLLAFLTRHDNFRVIIGNHEQFLLDIYRECMKEYDGKNDDPILQKIRNFFPTDGKTLTWELLEYVDTLPYYLELSDAICVHAGLQLNADQTVVPLKEQPINHFVYDRKFKEDRILPKTDKTVLFGHTPCSYENGTGQFIKTPKPNVTQPTLLTDYAKIRLDTGVAYTGMLGMLRREDMREFYVYSPT